MATDMWDLYVVVGSQLLRAGLHEDAGSGITEPVGRIKLKPGADRLEWLADAGCLVMYGKDQTIIVDKHLQQRRDLPPVMGVSPCGTMAFAADGIGPTYDMVVLPLSGDDKKPLRLTNMDLLRKECIFVPEMDVMVVVDGDAGTTVPRSILVIGLAQIREWLEDGTTHADRGVLDYDALNAAKEMIPLLRNHETGTTPMKMVAIPDHPGFICYWNTRPDGAITEGQMSIIEYLYWDKDESARGQVRQSSGPLALPRFWLSDIVMERSITGGLGVICTGVSRKKGDFYLGLRTMAVMEPDSGVRYGIQQGTFDTHMFQDVELRHADSLKRISPLPLAAGLVVLAEDPYREERLLRVDVKAASISTTHVELDVTPGPFVAVGERHHKRVQLAGKKEATGRRQLTSGYKGASTAKVSLMEDDPPQPDETAGGPFTGSAPPKEEPEGDFVDGEVVDDEPRETLSLPAASASTVAAASAPAPVAEPEPVVHTPSPPSAAPTPSPPPAAAPAAPASAKRVSTGGPLPVVPGVGLDLPLGMVASDCHLAVTVTVVGDGKQADLQWWLSQGQGPGHVLVQLHVRAKSQVNVRWSAVTL